MSLISRMKKQTCVHWSRTGVDGRGRPEFAEPVEKDCRWVNTVEKFLDLNAEEVVSNAGVYVSGVKVGDVLLLGTLEDSGLDSDNPLKNNGAWEIRRYDAVPNLRNTEVLYKAYL